MLVQPVVSAQIPAARNGGKADLVSARAKDETQRANEAQKQVAVAR
jgi:hypothetical protein